MSSHRVFIGLLLAGFVTTECEAQVLLPSQPVGVAVLVPNGIGFSYRSGRLRVGGFVSNGYSVGTLVPVYGGGTVIGPVPYYLPLSGSVSYRITNNFISPRVRLDGPFPPLTSQYDLSGVDLDVVPAAQAFGPQGAPAARVQAPPNKPAVAAAQAAKAAPARQEVAKNQPRPEEKRPRREEPPAAPNPRAESERLLALGTAAFGRGEFGVAARRFEQARDADAGFAKPVFHLVQARFALGKYQDAARLLEEGVKRHADWPRTDFQPRRDLYRGLEDDWRQQCQALEDVVQRQPKQASYLILLAHQKWFDGARPQAQVLFRQAGDLVENSPAVAAFLKADPVALK